jgi:RNA polymerase sigma factor (sigma-70 family)
MQTRAQALDERFSGAATVFIVDDDADVRAGLKALLSSVGLRSESYRSTAEFLQDRPSNAPSCLVLDVRLPGLGGLDFQAELTKAKIDIPIIFITGHADIPMTVRAMKAGAVEFLTKPIREQDLLDAVRTGLDRDRLRLERERETSALRTNFALLGSREQKVLELVTAGLMNKQIAAAIGLSEVTIKVHRHNLMKKLRARSLADLVRIADVLGVSAAHPLDQIHPRFQPSPALRSIELDPAGKWTSRVERGNRP